MKITLSKIEANMSNKIEEKAAIILQQGTHSLNHDTSEAYDRLYTEIHSLEGMARETFQYQFRNDYQTVVEKLRDGGTLSDEDKQLLAELVIDDAKSYVKHEKEFETWKDQIDRLLSELRSIQSKGVRTTDDLLHIQSICRDLRSVLPDITFYLRERERVKSYEQHDIQALPSELRKMLAEIVDAMMKSDKM
jgi:predicted  nucleic acid-binding Zn-ribbon protein